MSGCVVLFWNLQIKKDIIDRNFYKNMKIYLKVYMNFVERQRRYSLMDCSKNHQTLCCFFKNSKKKHKYSFVSMTHFRCPECRGKGLWKVEMFKQIAFYMCGLKNRSHWFQKITTTKKAEICKINVCLHKKSTEELRHGPEKWYGRKTTRTNNSILIYVCVRYFI